VTDIQNKYQEISQNIKELEAEKLMVNEKLIQSEAQNQQLEAAKLLTEEKLAEALEKNRELLEKLEAQEKTLLVNKSVDSYSFS